MRVVAIVLRTLVAPLILGLAALLAGPERGARSAVMKHGIPIGDLARPSVDDLGQTSISPRPSTPTPSVQAPSTLTEPTAPSTTEPSEIEPPLGPEPAPTPPEPTQPQPARAPQPSTAATPAGPADLPYSTGTGRTTTGAGLPAAPPTPPVINPPSLSLPLTGSSTGRPPVIDVSPRATRSSRLAPAGTGTGTATPLRNSTTGIENPPISPTPPGYPLGAPGGSYAPAGGGSSGPLPPTPGSGAF